MKNIKFLIISFSLIVFVFSACNTSKKMVEEPNLPQYGEKITASDYVSFDKVMSILEKEGTYKGKVKGMATGVCQKKGCWMTLSSDSSTDELFVKFKDYGFFMPFDIAGKEVVLRGTAEKETTSVEMLRHYALDGGATEEEVAKITEPETAFNFIADGVIVLTK